jgi:hypothetical protein
MRADEYLLTCLAVPAAAAVAAGRRGDLEDGLETAAWAAMFGGLITSTGIIAAASRVAPAAAGSRQIIADAHQHGVASAPVWLAGDSLGGAIFMLAITACTFLGVGAGGAVIGRAARDLFPKRTVR